MTRYPRLAHQSRRKLINEAKSMVLLKDAVYGGIGRLCVLIIDKMQLFEAAPLT